MFHSANNSTLGLCPVYLLDNVFLRLFVFWEALQVAHVISPHMNSSTALIQCFAFCYQSH